MQKYLNNWQSTLLAGVSAAATSAQIPAGDAAKLSLSGADYYVMTLEAAGEREIVHVTAVSGQTLTLLRGQEGSTAAAWAAGTPLEMRVTAAALARHEQATGGGATDLSVSRTATTVTVASSTGNDAPLPAASATEAGVLSAADKTKLDGIAANATANATNAQLRDRATHTGEQPMSSVTGLQTALDGKQATEAGKGLSSNDYTTAEKNKLAGLEASKWKGLHASLSALQTAHPTAAAGDFADVDTGAGADVVRYLWDVSDAKWVAQQGTGGNMTPAQIKSAYESNPDTNAYTDSEKTKLASVATGATANSTDAQLRTRFTHTGLQPISTVSGLEAALAAKQPTETGKGLSSNDYTTAEKTKLAGLESSRFKGLYASLAALQAAHPTGAAGDYADVDAGAGVDVVRYVWDVSDSAWVAIQGSGGSMTPAQVKSAYESNPDTNAYTDSEKAKLAAIATGATANQSDAHLLSRTNHTGTQAMSTVDGLAAALASKETGLTAGANIVIDRSNPAAPVISASGGGGGAFDMLSQLVASEAAIAEATTLGPSAFGKMHTCSGSSNYTVVLPAAAGNAGKLIGVRMSQSLGATRNITIDGNAAELIDGEAVRVMWRGEVAILLCDGAGWTKISGKSIPMSARYVYNSSFSVAHATELAVPLNVVEYDNGGLCLAAGLITFPRKSAWQIHGHCEWAPITVPRLYTSLRTIAGNQYYDIWEETATGNNYARQNPRSTRDVAAGEQVSLKIFQNSGSTKSTYYQADNPGQLPALNVIEVIKW